MTSSTAMALLVTLVLSSCISFVFGLNCSCGVENPKPRIYGGKKVTFMKYPWMAFVLVEKENKHLEGCGGSIINNLYILTASHCFKEAKKVTVGIGSIYDSTKNKMIEVDSFILHEEYKREHFRNDIALIKMKEPLKFSKDVRPICLPPKHMDLSGHLTVAGWGLAENKTMPHNLLEITVTEYDFAKCNKTFPHILPNMHFCASRVGKTTCQGDSGGPLWKHKKGKSYEVGIVSFNGDCGTSRAQVFTKVTSYIDWIKKHTADGEYCDD